MSIPPSAPAGPLTFVVVGGGPTGVEVAGALAELLDLAVRHDGFRFSRSTARIIVVDGQDRLLTPFAPSAAALCGRHPRGPRRRAAVWAEWSRRSPTTGVELDDGTRIATQTVIWAGGVTVAGTVASRLGIASGPGGRLAVEPDLSLNGRADAYAVGDAAAVPRGDGSGRVCPQLAQVAIQSGAHAARQVINRAEGRPTVPFHYRDKGIMATLGRRAAITEFPGGTLIKGTVGWLAWLGLHLVYLIGYRSRIIVLVNWAWRYLSWGSGPRVIVGDMLDVESGNRSRLRAADRHPGIGVIHPTGAGTVIDVEVALEEIDRKVLQLFALVGESVSGATHALLSGDREAAKIPGRPRRGGRHPVSRHRAPDPPTAHRGRHHLTEGPPVPGHGDPDAPRSRTERRPGRARGPPRRPRPGW